MADQFRLFQMLWSSCPAYWFPISAEAPYGYRVERNAGNEKVMVPDEEPAGIVRRIFEEIAAGKPQTEVARDLNKEKIPTPYQYRMRNQPEKLAEKPHLRWNRDYIAAILKNEVYLGRYVSGKDSQKYEPRFALCRDFHGKRRGGADGSGNGKGGLPDASGCFGISKAGKK